MLWAGAAFAGDPAPGAPPAEAWSALGSTEFYTKSLGALAMLFVLAVLIESALAVIFNWRLFLVLFYGRGVTTLVAIAVSALVVWSFKIDIVHTMLVNYGAGSDPDANRTLSRALTALILAGGSAGVYQVLVALGYRQPRTAEQVTPKPRPKKAWVAVRVARKNSVGPVLVKITDAGPYVAGVSPPQLAGVVAPVGFWYTFWHVFFYDRNRFPNAGGFEVVTSRQFSVEITGHDAGGNAVPSSLNGTYSFTDGAIIDLETTL